jgi:hypothetical protein
VVAQVIVVVVGGGFGVYICHLSFFLSFFVSSVVVAVMS